MSELTALLHTARPTVYRGVLMRSRLEARVAAWMDSGAIDWAYELRCYKSARGEYLPDFQVGPRTFVEVKPAIENAIGPIATQAGRGVAVLLDCLPDALVWLAWSDGRGQIASLQFGRRLGPVGFPGLCPAGHLTLIPQRAAYRPSCLLTDDCPTCGRPIRFLADELGVAS